MELPLPVRLLCSTFFAERKLKTISSKITQKDKSVRYSQNIPVPLRHFLFHCLCLLSFCRPRQQNEPVIFCKTNPLPSEIPKGAALLLLLL